MRKRKYGHFLKGTSAIYFVSLEVVTYGDPNNSYCSNKTKKRKFLSKSHKNWENRTRIPRQPRIDDRLLYGFYHASFSNVAVI